MQKKIFTALVACVAALPAFAELPRAELWTNATVAMFENRPDDAANAFAQIAALAADAKSWSEYALAAELRAATLDGPVGKESYTEIAATKALRDAFDAAPSPEAKIFLEARLAWAFLDLARCYRPGTLRGENDVEPNAVLPEDLAEWSDTQLREAAIAHYENVLAQSDLLKKIPIAAVQAQSGALSKSVRKRLENTDAKKLPFREISVLTLNDAPAAEFPTLYDFIARDAEKFFTELSYSDEAPENFPGDEILFADTATFLENVPAAAFPAKNCRERALQILRERTQFHAADADPTALARATLDRISFAWEISFGNVCAPEASLRDYENVLETYEAALKKFIEDYAYFPISAEASEELAFFLVRYEKREPEAYEVADRAVAKFGETKNANGCNRILQSLKASSLQIELPDVWTHAVPAKFSVTAKNAKQLRFRAVPANWRDYLKKEHNRPNKLSKNEIAALRDAGNAVEWTLPLDSFHDFRSHNYEVEIPTEKLTPGFYFVFTALNDEPFDAKDAEKPQPVWVGDLAAISERANADGTIKIRVVNAVTGAPIVGATVSAWNKARWGGERISVPAVETDALGEAVISGLKKDRDPLILVEYAAGTATHAISLENISVPKERVEMPDLGKTIALFADREIFRPGQKISFKGVLAKNLTKTDVKPGVFPGQNVKISLVQRSAGKEQILASTDAWSNGFGSFAGTLDIPQNLMLGRCELRADCETFLQTATQTIRIEEYRRPKSEIKIDGTSEPQILGGTAYALITGTSFTGAPLDGAKVRWTVKNWSGGTEKIKASGEGELGADGTLKISWQTERKKLDPYEARNLSPEERRVQELDLDENFVVEAEIVDSNGETRTDTEWIVLKNSDFTFIVAGENCEQDSEIQLFTESYRERTPGDKSPVTDVQIDVFRVIEPEKYIFPKNIIGQEPAPKLALGEKVFSGVGKSSEKLPVATIPAGTLAPGRYRVIAQTKDAFGQTLTADDEFVVWDSAAKTFPLKEAFWARDISKKNSDSIDFIWGSAVENARAFVEVFVGEKRLNAFYTDEGRTQQKISIPATEEMRGKVLSVIVTQSANGEFFRENMHLAVPLKNELKISPVKLTKQIVPGAAEVWTFKITREDGSPAAGTEVLAELYDLAPEMLERDSASNAWNSMSRKFLRFDGHSMNAWRFFSTSLGKRYYSFWQKDDKAFPALRLPDWTLSFSEYYSNAPWGEAPAEYCVGAAGGGNGRAFLSSFRSDLRMAKSASADAVPAPEAAPVAGNEVSADTEKLPPRVPFAPEKLDVPVRKNLQETAFFYPYLMTDVNGLVTLQFVAPDALTRWHLRIFAHDRELRSGAFTDAEIVTSKDLMIQPDAPRFLREGDEIKFPMKLTNRTDAEMTGTLRLDAEFFSADGKKIEVPAESAAEQSFRIPAKASATFFREIKVPNGTVAMKFRASAKNAAGVSDGEEAALPVLPREVIVTESRTALVRGNAETSLEFEKLAAAGTNNANTPRTLAFCLDAPTNAHEIALLALPYLAEQAQEFESSDSIFYRLYANAIGKTICENHPELQETFALWRAANPEKFDSPLNGTATNTPYFGIAQRESEQRRAVGNFFEPNKTETELYRAIDELMMRHQENDGKGWAWFPSSRSGANMHVTREILTGFGHLLRRVNDEALEGPISAVVSRPLEAQDAWLLECFEPENGERRAFGVDIAQYLYMRSLLADRYPVESTAAWTHYLSEAKKTENWAKQPRMVQAQIALALWANGEKDVPAKIVESLRQRAISDPQLGMYWNEPKTPFAFGLPEFSPIETQAAMIELFATVAQDTKAVEEMKIWLLTRKKTHVWQSSRASANALFALFENGGTTAGTPKISSPASVKFVDAEARPLFPGTLDVAPALAKISAKNESAAPAFVSAHWTYAQPLSDVVADAPANGFSVKKSVFKRERGRDGKYTLTPARLEILKPGDELLVRLVVRADRDFEFVCLKDMRGSGCEPTESLSGWKINGGLWFYGEPRDTETRFFFDRLPSGTHVFEYTQRVRTSGLYSGGFAEIRSLYAPEFAAHSDAETLVSM